MQSSAVTFTPLLKKLIVGELMFPMLFSKELKYNPKAGAKPVQPSARLQLAPRKSEMIAKKATQNRQITKKGMTALKTPKRRIYIIPSFSDNFQNQLILTQVTNNINPFKSLRTFSSSAKSVLSWSFISTSTQLLIIMITTQNAK